MDILSGKTVERHFDLNKALIDFHDLFNIKNGDDRTIAIIGATFLEMTLEHILFSFFPDNNKDVEKMMDFNQPMGNFSNKITMAYCLGLIEKIVKEDLNLVRKIRNEFAHDLYASFENDKIKSWCKELKWHKIVITPNPPSEANSRDLFTVGVNTLISHLIGCVSVARGDKRVIKK